MKSIRYYNETLIELQTAQKRLKALKERQEEIYTRVCSPQGWQTSSAGKVSAKVLKSSQETYVSIINKKKKKKKNCL